MMIRSSFSEGFADGTLGGVDVVGGAPDALGIDDGLEVIAWGSIGGPPGPLLGTFAILFTGILGLTIGGWG